MRHELWTVIEPLTRAVLANEAIYQEDLLLVMQRSGFTEETYSIQRLSGHRPDELVGRSPWSSSTPMITAPFTLY